MPCHQLHEFLISRVNPQDLAPSTHRIGLPGFTGPITSATLDKGVFVFTKRIARRANYVP